MIRLAGLATRQLSFAASAGVHHRRIGRWLRHIVWQHRTYHVRIAAQAQVYTSNVVERDLVVR